MGIIIFFAALVGLALALGLDLIEAVLYGISTIDGVKLWIPVLMAVLGFVFAGLLINWSIKSDKHVMKVMRTLSACAVVLYFIVVLVLLCSLWADQWLIHFREWMAMHAKTIYGVNLAGCFLLVYSIGWISSNIYRRCSRARQSTRRSSES